MELCSLKDIRALLEPLGFRFSRSMGQNFLVERRVPERIAAECGASHGSGVLEIGPGVGCLTRELSARVGKVAAVELDRSLLPALDITLADCENVEIINADILKIDLKALAAEHFSGLEPMVCANIPYNITSPIITCLLESRVFTALTLMVQKEVAQRICAAPGTSEYGAFSVYVRWHAEPEILFTVPRGCFYPPPKVDSAVLRLAVRPAPPAEVCDEAMFFRTVRAAFGQRRKTLLNALSASLGDKERIQSALTAADIDPQIRGERLSIPEFARLANALWAIKDG